MDEDSTANIHSFWYQVARPRLDAYINDRPTDDLARERLHAEIAALERLVTSFRDVLNSHSPIVSLPTELLARCFRILADCDPPCTRDVVNGQNHRLGTRKTLGWISITHVCRRWRAIALSQPLLWSSATLELGPQWFAEMLTRTQSAPLAIKSFMPLSKERHSSIHDGILAAINRYGSRIYELDIQHYSISDRSRGEVLDWIRAILATPMPQLHSLTIHCSDCAGDARKLVFGIYPHFLLNNSSSLRHLSLRFVTYNWIFVPFQSLITLDISQPANLSKIRNLDPLFDILKNNPHLESLALRGVLPNLDVPLSDPRRIRHAHLRKILLTGRDISCGSFLSAMELQAAPNVDITLHDIDVDMSYTYCATLFSSVGQLLPPAHGLRLALVCGVEWLTIEISRALSMGDNESIFFLNTTKYEDGIDRLEVFADIMHNMFEHLPLADIKQFSISKSNKARQKRVFLLWQHALPQLRKVEYLSCDLIDVIAYLSQGKANNGDADPVFCPLLKTLSIVMADNQADSAIHQKLLPALKTRKALGFPIKDLHIVSSKNIPEADKEAMQEFVLRISQSDDLF